MNATIIQAFQNLADTNPKSLAAIEQRSTGSQWIGGRIPWQILSILPWKEVDQKEYSGTFQSILFDKSCQYFHFENIVTIGYQNFLPLSFFYDCFEAVEVREGAHGKELVSPLVKPKETNEAWLILGVDKNFLEKQIVWTAYPGTISCSLRQFDWWDGTASREMLNLLSKYPVAVKGITQNHLKK